MSFIHIIFAPLMAFLIMQEWSYAQPCCNSFPVIGELSLGYDNFRGIPDGSWNGNTGIVIESNFGLGVMDLFGIQAGGSYGVYDWYGRSPNLAEGNAGCMQQQGFVTVGLTRQTSCWDGLQGGLAIDWMFNDSFGEFGVNPTFGQFRYQAGYLWDGSDEFGFWGTLYMTTDHKTAFEIPLSFRAVSQINLFWRHNFENSGEAMLWLGLPYTKSLMFQGSLSGTYIVGGSFRVPLTSRLSLEGRCIYMGPKGNSTSLRFQNYTANAYIGLSYAFGGREYSDRQACPYLPVANNSNFLVDTNFNQ